MIWSIACNLKVKLCLRVCPYGRIDHRVFEVAVGWHVVAGFDLVCCLDSAMGLEIGAGLDFDLLDFVRFLESAAGYEI